MMTLVIGCLFFLNGLTFCLFLFDKQRAVRHQWRIPETTLLGLSLLGGAAGGILAMHLVRHKTQKWRFAVGLPVMLVVQVGLVWYFL